ncbi:MAG: hypothetical protein IT442_17940 [Phycisphaeraceae bacterium]|nr:hypothetical protein [Phycisphaeraceae bacterium]
MIADIADAVVAYLNDPVRGFSQAFVAERSYRPRVELAQMQGLVVTVVPKAVTSTTASRLMAQDDVQIDVAVQKKLIAPADERLAETDELMELVQAIANSLRARPMGDGAWLSQTNEPIYVPEHLDQFEVFTSVLTVTYRLLH